MLEVPPEQELSAQMENSVILEREGRCSTQTLQSRLSIDF